MGSYIFVGRKRSTWRRTCYLRNGIADGQNRLGEVKGIEFINRRPYTREHGPQCSAVIENPLSW